MNSSNNQQQGSNKQRPEMMNSPRVGDRYIIETQPATEKPNKEVKINIKNISVDDLKFIQREDSFLYYSIPEVRSAKMLLKDIDEIDLTSGKHIKADQPKRVTRSTCISFEAHPDKILQDFLFEDDEDMELEGVEDPMAFILTAASNGRSYSRFTEQ